MKPDTLCYLTPPSGPGFYTNIIENEPDGFVLKRLRLFIGKSRQGMAWRIIRDPIFEGIDAWTRKHGLGRVEFCPIEWIKTETVDIDVEPQVEIDFTTEAGVYIHWVRNHLAKSTRFHAEAILAQTHDLYAAPDAKKITDRYTVFEQQYLRLPDMTKLSPQGAHRTEVKRQELINIYQAMEFARDHAMKSLDNGLTKNDIIAALLDRENKLLDQAVATAKDINSWDRIVEAGDTPDSIRNYFRIISAIRPWEELAEPQKKLFREAVKSAAGGP